MPFWNHKDIIVEKGRTYRKAKSHNNFTLHSTINCICPKRAALSASMTVEAALVMPLFLFFSIIFIHVILLISFQTRVDEAMYNSVRTLAKTEYVAPKSANYATAMGMVWLSLGTKKAKAVHVVGENAGMVAVSSDFSDDNIDLVINYVSNTPFDFLNVANFTCEQRAYVRKWIGNEDMGDGSIGATLEPERLVYITENGVVYHSDRNCTYLRLSIQSVSKSSIPSMRNIEGAKFYACERCGGSGSSVYITDYGNRYHSDINCSGLKRMIIVVPIRAVEGWRPCSRCGG